MRYALKKVRKITGRDIATGKNKFVLADLHNITISGDSDVVWADGSDGAHLVGFDTAKTSTIEAENGSIDIGYLETQTGGTLKKVENGTGVLFTETLTVADGKVTTSHKASGTVGNEIGFVYPLDATSDPDRNNAYEQAATVSATAFAYDPDTKAITLPTGVFKDGDKVYVEYFPTFSSYEELDNDSDKFSETVAVYVDAWFTDICTKKDVPLQLVCPSGKVSGTIDYAFGDDVAVQSVSIEATTSCGEKNFWKLYKYDMTEVVD
jgi:hypothetical protein